MSKIEVEDYGAQEAYAQFWAVLEDDEEVCLCTSQETAERIAALLREEEK